MKVFPASVYFGLLVLLIIIYYFHGRLAKRFSAGTAKGLEGLERIVTAFDNGKAGLDRQAEIFEIAAQDLLAAAWVKVATTHSTYEFDSDALPGLITVKCVSCNEMVGTMDNSGDDAMVAPSDLVKGHIDEVYRRQVNQGRVAARELMADLK